MLPAKPAAPRPFLSSVFLSAKEARLRAGWRLLVQFILMMVLLAACIMPIVIIDLALALGWLETNVFWASQIAEFFALLVSIFVARRLIDRRTFSSLGVQVNRRTGQDLMVGILITFVMMAFIFGVNLGAGWMSIRGAAWQTDSASKLLAGLCGWLVVFILVGWNEELWFRGYLLQTIASGMNLWWGVILSSLIFGAAHLTNPNAEAGLMVMIGIFLAGLLMAFAYVRTKRLWLPIGLHIGWNFFEGVIFGFPVSGLSTYRLLQLDVHGPELWTGGAFGPEAGVVVLPATALGFMLVHLYARASAPSD